MDTNAIAAAIQAEIARLQSALSILNGGTAVKRRGRRAKTVKKKWTPAQRAEARARAKTMWAKRKRAAKKG
jgi:hypothetical protein